MKKHIFNLVLISILINVKASAQGVNSINEKHVEQIDQLVNELSKSDQFSGAVLIAKDRKILYQRAVGFADKDNKMENTIHTKFNLASMNKMFTSVAIAQLVESNQLKYSDKVVKYLPNYIGKFKDQITIEQLLTHTAGTGDFFRNPLFMDIKDTAKSIGTYLSLCIDEPLLFEPGLKFQYSNYGYIMLGAIIEKVSKKSFYHYVKEHIFSKAGMSNTDSYETDQSNDNLAIGYALPPPMPGRDLKSMPESMGKEPNTKMIEVKGTSAGGGYSTVEDLHKFSMSLLSGQLISKESLEFITRGRISIPMPPMPPNMTNMKQLSERKYGFGFGEKYENKIRIIGHNGGAPGVDVQIDIYPDLGYTVVVLSNYDRSIMPIINSVEEMIVNISARK